MAQQMASGQRKFDSDGKLAEDMQATVRSGDPWNEGIVWPRIAEISLLGGLGCGKVSILLLCTTVVLLDIHSAGYSAHCCLGIIY